MERGSEEKGSLAETTGENGTGSRVPARGGRHMSAEEIGGAGGGGR